MPSSLALHSPCFLKGLHNIKKSIGILQRNYIENQVFIVESPHLVLVNAPWYLSVWSNGRAWKARHNIAVCCDRVTPEPSAAAGGVSPRGAGLEEPVLLLFLGVDLPIGHKMRFFLTEKWKQKDPELVSGLVYFSGCIVNHLEYGESCLQGAPREKRKPAENSPGSCNCFAGFRCKLLFCPLMSVMCCSHHKSLEPWESGYIACATKKHLCLLSLLSSDEMTDKWKMTMPPAVVAGAGPPQVKPLQELFFKKCFEASPKPCVNTHKKCKPGLLINPITKVIKLFTQSFEWVQKSPSTKSAQF